MYQNEIHGGKIYEVISREKSIWGIQLHNDRGKESEREYYHEYRICIDSSRHEVIEQPVRESLIFPNKKALIDHLTKEKK